MSDHYYQKYEGWENRETSCVVFWIDHNESLHTHWVGKAHQCTHPDVLAAEMKHWMEQCIPDSLQGMFLDLYMGAIARVNWREIAEHLIRKAQEEICDR